MKISVNLSDEALFKADELATGMGLSRSSLISMLIFEKHKETSIIKFLPDMIDAYNAEQQKNTSENQNSVK